MSSKEIELSQILALRESFSKAILMNLPPDAAADRIEDGSYPNRFQKSTNKYWRLLSWYGFTEKILKENYGDIERDRTIESIWLGTDHIEQERTHLENGFENKRPGRGYDGGIKEAVPGLGNSGNIMAA